LTLPAEALARLGPDGLHPVNSILQTECSSFGGAVDGELDGGAGLHRDRTQRTGFISDAWAGGRCDHWQNNEG
jgi:hypothetical protein